MTRGSERGLDACRQSTVLVTARGRLRVESSWHDARHSAGQSVGRWEYSEMRCGGLVRRTHRISQQQQRNRLLARSSQLSAPSALRPSSFTRHNSSVLSGCCLLTHRTQHASCPHRTLHIARGEHILPETRQLDSNSCHPTVLSPLCLPCATCPHLPIRSTAFLVHLLLSFLLLLSSSASVRADGHQSGRRALCSDQLATAVRVQRVRPHREARGGRGALAADAGTTLATRTSQSEPPHTDSQWAVRTGCVMTILDNDGRADRPQSLVTPVVSEHSPATPTHCPALTDTRTHEQH